MIDISKESQNRSDDDGKFYLQHNLNEQLLPNVLNMDSNEIVDEVILATTISTTSTTTTTATSISISTTTSSTIAATSVLSNDLLLRNNSSDCIIKVETSAMANNCNSTDILINSNIGGNLSMINTTTTNWTPLTPPQSTLH